MSVFADTGYWVALLDQRDQLHDKARSLSERFEGESIVTTDFVLNEVANFFAHYGPDLRTAAHSLVKALMDDPGVEVLPASRESFLEGAELYAARPDKGYSHTDCVSFVAMRRQGWIEALSYDRHFEQEGFRALLRD